MAKEKISSPSSSPTSSSKKPKISEKDDDSTFIYNTSNISSIASPLASDKLCKKLYKVIRKASKSHHLKRGVREVAKAIRKGEKGMVLLAGDINPIDVITHLPVFCEENNVPYVYVPEKSVLGMSSGSKRPTSCLMVCPSCKGGLEFDYKDKYDECVEKIKDIPISA